MPEFMQPAIARFGDALIRGVGRQTPVSHDVSAKARDETYLLGGVTGELRREGRPRGRPILGDRVPGLNGSNVAARVGAYPGASAAVGDGPHVSYVGLPRGGNGRDTPAASA